MLRASRSRLLSLIVVGVLSVGAALVVGIGGQSGVSGGVAPASAATPKTVKITIKDFTFSKATVTVKVGQKITWTNQDEMKHNARSNKSGGPKGPLLGQGKSYTWTAKKAGTYTYHCSPHPFMTAKIIVKK